MKDIRLLHKHSAKCAYRQYRQDNPGSPWYLSAHYWNLRTIRWQQYFDAVCNDPDCKARLRVRVSLLEDQLPSFIPEDAA